VERQRRYAAGPYLSFAARLLSFTNLLALTNICAASHCDKHLNTDAHRASMACAIVTATKGRRCLGSLTGLVFSCKPAFSTNASDPGKLLQAKQPPSWLQVERGRGERKVNDLRLDKVLLSKSIRNSRHAASDLRYNSFESDWWLVHSLTRHTSILNNEQGITRKDKTPNRTLHSPKTSVKFKVPGVCTYDSWCIFHISKRRHRHCHVASAVHPFLWLLDS
jgi:hypothetical protein